MVRSRMLSGCVFQELQAALSAYVSNQEAHRAFRAGWGLVARQRRYMHIYMRHVTFSIKPLRFFRLFRKSVAASIHNAGWAGQRGPASCHPPSHSLPRDIGYSGRRGHDDFSARCAGPGRCAAGQGLLWRPPRRLGGRDVHRSGRLPRRALRHSRTL